MVDSRNVGKQIRELRKSRGWKQYQLADRIGISRSALSNIENGNRSLTLNLLHTFAEIFHVSVETFGINVNNFDEAMDLTARLEAIFKSDISEEKKTELFNDIMAIYLSNKK